MTMITVWARRAPLAGALAALFLVSACGGGGGGSDGTGASSGRPAPNPQPNPPTNSCSAAATVCLLTSKGEIVIELESVKAPVTVANFLQYVNEGFYTSTLFHRVVPGFVVQGGGFITGSVAKTGLRSAIVLESNNGLSNVRGTIAMARTSVPNSATSQFYVNSVDNSACLDHGRTSCDTTGNGYAVFGRVISGLSTIDAISAEPQLYAGAETPATEVLLYWAKQLR